MYDESRSIRKCLSIAIEYIGNVRDALEEYKEAGTVKQSTIDAVEEIFVAIDKATAEIDKETAPF